jgi:hypothetical protein
MFGGFAIYVDGGVDGFFECRNSCWMYAIRKERKEIRLGSIF